MSVDTLLPGVENPVIRQFLGIVLSSLKDIHGHPVPTNLVDSQGRAVDGDNYSSIDLKIQVNGLEGEVQIELNGGGPYITGLIDSERLASFMTNGTGSAPHYNNTTRPDASTVPSGFEIYNDDDLAPNYSDGTNWRDALGELT